MEETKAQCVQHYPDRDVQKGSIFSVCVFLSHCGNKQFRVFSSLFCCPTFSKNTVRFISQLIYLYNKFVVSDFEGHNNRLLAITENSGMQVKLY